jgi:3'-phosphoadenosine 5'-phosphosulfate sulfotransferase (PAPS reductase)/FAD synthetase
VGRFSSDIRQEHLPAGFAARFWAKVERSEGCWLWTGAREEREEQRAREEREREAQERRTRAQIGAQWRQAQGPMDDRPF